jgi:ABC-type multidrug transport system fused ATPase/permease subunit
VHVTEKQSTSGYAILGKLALAYPGLLVITIVLAIVAGLITAPTPYLAKIIIDEIIFKNVASSGASSISGWFGLSDSLWIIICLVGLGVFMKLLSAAINGWQCYYILNITRNGLYRKRLDTALRVIGASQKFFEKMEPARIASRLGHDVNAMDGSIWNLLKQVVASFFLIIVIIAFMLLMNPFLTAVILITLPITAVITFFVYRFNFHFNKKESDRIAALIATTTEMFSAIKLVRMFNAEPFFLKRFAQRAEDLRREGITHWTTIHSSNYYMGFVSNLGADLFLLVGGYLALQGQISFGEFFAFFSYQSMLWGPINVLLNTGNMIQTGAASAEKVGALQQVDQEPYLSNKNSRSSHPFRGEIICEDLCFHYRDNDPVLRNINLTIKPGTMTALVGQSGSGKTTLASLLTGLHLPTSGRLLIDGIDVRDWDLRKLRSHIGIVLQDAVLINDTLRCNLTLGRDIPDDRIWAALALAHIDDFVRDLKDGLDTMVGVNGATLSGGQRQRIAIARVFLKDPSLIILDEATSALDSETEKAIQRSFDALMSGRTSVVIAHRLSTIYKADQIVVLHQGKIVETGTHEDLTRRENGHYRQLYEAQVEGMIPMSGATRPKVSL